MKLQTSFHLIKILPNFSKTFSEQTHIIILALKTNFYFLLIAQVLLFVDGKSFSGTKTVTLLVL